MERRDPHVGMESGAQILLGLLPDVGLYTAAQDGACDNQPGHNDDHRRSQTGDVLLSTRHH